MKRMIILTLFILISAAIANAETYTWTDDQGVVTFTDNPTRIPSSYGSRAKTGAEITKRPPSAHNSIRKQGTYKLQAAIPRNRIVARSKQTGSSQGLPQPLKGQLEDPAPPGKEQSTPDPPENQPEATLSEMKLPRQIL